MRSCIGYIIFVSPRATPLCGSAGIGRQFKNCTPSVALTGDAQFATLTAGK